MRGLEQIPWLYDALCSVYERTGLARWRRWLVDGARGRALDVGCGTGRNLPLYGAAVRVVGLDPAWDSLRRARRRAPRVRDRSVDTVVSGLVFCSVPDARRGLVEVGRVLRPDGRLRLLEHVRSTRPWKARLQDRLERPWVRVSGGCHPNRDTERAVEAAGFAIEADGRRAKGDMRRFSARPSDARDRSRSTRG